MKILATLFAIFQIQNVSSFFIDFDYAYELLAKAIHPVGLLVKYFEILKYGESLTEETFPPGLPIDEEYDFIIAGASPAGCVLAARLSEKYKVLLLEPGQGESAIGRIPLFSPVLHNTGYNWDYEVQDEPNVGLGLKNKTVKWPRGKCLGGSSCINYMIYTRGNKMDFDEIGAKNPGWSYKDVLQHYKNVEQAMKIMYMEPEFHGLNGELSTSTSYYDELVQRFTLAGGELGYEIGDYSGSNQTRFSPIQSNLKDGLRHSAGSAFLFPNRYRSNLHVRPLCTVNKVLIENGVAKGVEYFYNGVKSAVKANKEVILSAGVLNSPQILMLSGIGPKADLEKFNIEVIKDCPVGKKMFDHAAFIGLTYFVKKSGITLNPIDFINPKNWFNLFLSDNSRLSSLGSITGIGYIKLNGSSRPSSRPDFELIMPTGSLISEIGTSANMFNIDQTVFFKHWGPLIFQSPYKTGTFIPMQLKPLSYGYLTIKSDNIFDKPLFYPKYYTDPKGQDMKEMIGAIRVARSIIKTKAFQEIGASLYDSHVPGCEKYKYDSDEYWQCAVRTFTISLWHQVATAKMGPADDPEAIVDSDGKVYGIQNLRVADCSIFPIPIAGHTNAPSMMLGENIAQRILKLYATTETV